MTDLRVPMDPIFSAFGVPAVVTRPAPDDDPIVTTAVWVMPTADLLPMGQDFQRRERRYLVALRRDAVPTLPRGTTIDAAEASGLTARTWRVDSIESIDTEAIRAWVVPVELET